jgi:hypothetical protein
VAQQGKLRPDTDKAIRALMPHLLGTWGGSQRVTKDLLQCMTVNAYGIKASVHRQMHPATITRIHVTLAAIWDACQPSTHLQA